MNQDWITAFEALRNVYIDGAYSNIAINEAIPRHAGCRDSFVRSMVKGTIRDTLTLDRIIDGLATRSPGSIKNRVRIILRMGLYAIRSMDSVPEHSAVDEAVKIARKVSRGSEGFINAMLRSYLRKRDDIESAKPDTGTAAGLAIRHAFPEDLAELLYEQYGDETDRILEGLNTPPPVVLRVNTLKTTADELTDLLEERGITAYRAEGYDRALIASGRGIAGSDLFRQGLYSIQSLSSIEAIEAFGPVPGSRVLDMCASPGGKSAMMAEMMENQGSILSCDIHGHRLDLIRAYAERTGAGIIETRLMDGTEYDRNLEGTFDYVLADVPCSGIGVIGSKPEIRFRINTRELGDLIKTQKAILVNALRYCRDGGKVMYSTCTLNREENEGVVKSVIEECRLGSIVEMRTLLPYNNKVGFFYSIIGKNVHGDIEGSR